ncbi:type I restriction-modification system subunit M [[Mannheimia] succiniciproducens]|uniref:site-specific DNA-methyltransferase (adenine-specific) n=1 Tax=Mannheimia succiniciproducens (strain KCTC 0769BP / MBEL55E) TaxID=221988 RepID=Q65QI8_MANSM|nr:class I SAM-dependent DNA methyltransferase [[Mannheimia] succiniciproducens]AAU38772.1 HsdM protein [[Mannheimia] succiniciproducens MBEL55E]
MTTDNLHTKQSTISSVIWSMANMLRGTYRPPQYRRVMLPLIVLARFDAILAPYTDAMKAKADELQAMGGKAPEGALYEMALTKAADPNRKQPLYNTSGYNLQRLLADQDHIAANLVKYLQGFSAKAKDIFDKFEFENEIEKLDSSNRLYAVVSQFQKDLKENGIDLSPQSISNLQMGYIFEELVRKFNEQANEEAGDHFTPREVINLMVNLIFEEDQQRLSQPHAIASIYDPTAGTGGMLSESEKHLKSYNDSIKLQLFGQEYNAESYAICCADLLIKDEPISNLVFGDTLGVKNSKNTGTGFVPHDGHQTKKFDYMFSNPPFGVEWKNEQDFINDEAKSGFAGRFGAGLPRINDGSLLFLQHMISKMKPVEEGGSRIAVVFNGSPLFTGDAGSGESNIRRWIIENDWLEAIIALPDQLFYNTGIYTYVWIVSNKKSDRRKGKVQLIDGTQHYQKMAKSLGDKRNELSPAQIADLTRLYADFKDGASGRISTKFCSKIFNNQDFGYLKLTVERPLRLNFQAGQERIEKVKTQTAFINLAVSKKRKDEAQIKAEEAEGQRQQQAILAALSTIGDGLYQNRTAFLKLLDKALKGLDFKLGAPLKKAIIEALSERDQSADICLDSKGNPEADSQLRDTELVPLPKEITLPLPVDYGEGKTDELVKQVKAHCEAYLQAEVLPHVDHAWIDYSKTKVGYEIPINRHFYQYQPPRALDEIKAEISELEAEIMAMLGNV